MWLVPIILFATLIAFNELGFRLGNKLQREYTGTLTSEVNVVQAGILGMLGLLLGFTISMAVNRFELRRQLVLEEANAIGTCYLRTQLVAAPDGPNIAILLRQYVDVRAGFVEAGEHPDKLLHVRENTARLQMELWTLAIAYGRRDPNPVTAGLFLQSLNEVIDLESARWTAFQSRVPDSVIYVNGILATLAAGLVGYSFGLRCHRDLICSCMLAAAITVVLAVIIDLDQPRMGYIRVSQQPMTDLQYQLHHVKQ